MHMKTPDRRITVLAYTMLTICLLVYTYACLAASTVTVPTIDMVYRRTASAASLAPPATNSQRGAGLFSGFVGFEIKEAGGERRFRVNAE